MLARSALIHPKLTASLPQFYPSSLTVQKLVVTQNALGEKSKNPESWSNVAGLVDLPCRCAPKSATENKGERLTFEQSSFTIAIAGHYPAILPKMRAVVDGVNYDILGVRSDDEQKTTSLDAQVVKL